MLRVVKPKNARSKRAMLAREPQEVEPPKTCIFVKGTSTGERLNGVLKDLMSLKRPNAVSFSKKNAVHPFESTDSFTFWSQKNDASLFLVGTHSKKRPHDLTFIRMYDYRVLEMLELGVEAYTPMSAFSGRKPPPGHRPLMTFDSPLFDTHPRFQQVKSLLLDLFNGAEIDAICLAGLEHVVQVSLAPPPPGFTNESTSSAELPLIHVRCYAMRFLASGQRTPRVELEPIGPSLDVSLRRSSPADEDLWRQATKRRKMEKRDVEHGLGKKRKNLAVDEGGDLIGRVHVGKQDLGKLQGRKVKALKEERTKRRKVDHDEEEEE
ncbi:Brix-domain-containing protein [Dacryopinax primogenitus]|uniref:Ribosome production factor 2 homolog n=1 Tax=Dacryopinax primogenitus (strain DJM 731) TaxID=1858805 RepID=M5GGQ5_DACPD|nr:Brix-domain-containing protein [Dacryopinax primogenitus]EJU05898.1 Brix-domain-containing protein [Dacryopinax primogenitus]